MNTILLLAALAADPKAAAPAPAAEPAAAPYKVAFDLTTNDPNDQKVALRWLKEVNGLNPKNQMEVVMYSKGIELVVSDKTTLAKEVAEAQAQGNVTFKVCAVALKNLNVDKAKLLAKVEVVPDGIGELVAKQKEGWGYIKVLGPK